jgi:hypothetical protein
MSSHEPDLPAAPEQLGTEVYGADGRLAYSIVKENGKMVYRPGVQTLGQQAEAQGLATLQRDTLARLGKTPAEYTASAQTAADARTAGIMGDVNRQAATGQRNINESMNATGRTGSRAAVDTAAELERARLDTAAKVGSESTAMRDSLVQNRINNDVGLFNLYKSTNDSAWAKTMANANFAGGQANANRAQDLQQWGQSSSNAMNDWNAQNQNDPWNKYISPTLSSGAYLWGAGAFK